MGMAEEMVRLAERFRALQAAADKQQQHPGAGGSLGAVAAGGGGSSFSGLDPETHAALVSMGIASPVTRDTAGG
jgi:hypothetical protein